jgi:hypothetical protein
VEKKYLCGICYALEDFEHGIHVETLLRPLEEGSQDDATSHWEAISPLLESTARNIAGDRRHNKFHSVLAIIVYGKDVFVALLQSYVDQNFPYHMPHTLALRQLYYWLFCAIILSGAAGGFADQWSSHAFLADFLDGRLRNLKDAARRRDDIFLRPIEPWDGGNYSLKYPKRGQKPQMTGRQKVLLLPAIAAVALPVVIAFIMSWYTPTTGLGDRGIMELSFAGMWILNFLITMSGSLMLPEKNLHQLFKIYFWNTFWSLGSLYILFGAFQGMLRSFALSPKLRVNFYRMVQQLQILVCIFQQRRLRSVHRSEHERHDPEKHLQILLTNDRCLTSHPALDRSIRYLDQLGSDSIYNLERR